MVSAFFEKKRFFFKFGFADSQGGPGRVPRRALGAPEISKGALGKVARVQGGPFWGVLDRYPLAMKIETIETVLLSSQGSETLEGSSKFEFWHVEI